MYLSICLSWFQFCVGSVSLENTDKNTHKSALKLLILLNDFKSNHYNFYALFCCGFLLFFLSLLTPLSSFIQPGYINQSGILTVCQFAQLWMTCLSQVIFRLRILFLIFETVKIISCFWKIVSKWFSPRMNIFTKLYPLGCHLPVTYQSYSSIWMFFLLAKVGLFGAWIQYSATSRR